MSSRDKLRNRSPVGGGNAGQDVEAKAQMAKDPAKGKPSSETLNKAKVKAEDALE